MNTSASNSYPARNSSASEESDLLLAALKDARNRRDQADQDIRILLAYARELARPRPYRLIDLAVAAGMSVSGVRSAYTRQHTETAQRLLCAAGDGQSTSRTTERTPDNAR